MSTQVVTCFRHPDRETGVRCQRCERPICPDCMVPAPVGVQCVECVRRYRHRVRQPRTATGWASVSGLLIAANVGVWALGLASGDPQALLNGSPLAAVAGLSGPGVAAGQWWRLLTAGFLHAGLLHLGLNMMVLYLLGPPLERSLGRAGFATLYLLGLVASSLGALLAAPRGLTIGASGAIFCIMGATVLGQRAAGIDLRSSGILVWIAINIAFSFIVPGISIGAHLGGLAAGLVAGALLFRPRLHPALGTIACLALAAAGFVAALWVASNPVLL